MDSASQITWIPYEKLLFWQFLQIAPPHTFLAIAHATGVFARGA